MPTIRQRLTNFLLGDEKRRLEAVTQRLWEAYQEGPYSLTPGELVRQLSEYDSSLLDDLVNQLQWERVGMLGYGQDSDAERQRFVKESQRLWKYNPLAQWSVWTWTDYGFGDEVLVTCEDEDAEEVFAEAWYTSSIFDDDKIHELSNNVLVEGNVYIVAYESTMDGSMRFSTIPSTEIAEIVTSPSDKTKALFYKRQWIDAKTNRGVVLYYPDWEIVGDDELDTEKLLPDGALRSDVSGELTPDNGDGTGKPSTIAYILHVAHNRKEAGSLYGWPIIGIASPYLRAHKQFVENRLTVSAQKASFVREFITGGGSRGVAAVKAKMGSTLSQSNYIDTNPPSVGGSLIHNQAIEHRDLPMGTGASDAKSDNEMFTWQALIGCGLFPTSAGLDTSRWATALAMDKTQSMLWSRYQTFWSAQFRRIVEIVLTAHERRTGTTFSTHDCDVSIDSLNLVDFPAVVESLSQLIQSALTPLVDNGTIPVEAAKGIAAEAWRLALQALGVTNAAELTSDDVFGIGQPGGAAAEALRSATVALARGEISEVDFAGFVQDAIAGLG